MKTLALKYGSISNVKLIKVSKKIFVVKNIREYKETETHFDNEKEARELFESLCNLN